MKIKLSIVLIQLVIMLCICCSAVCSETAETVLIQDEEWSWSRGAYNTFSGQIDLQECISEELLITISADLPYDKATEYNSTPVFTSVNGKRIVMAKQSDTVQVVPDKDNPVMTFTASFRLPEKKRVNSVPIHLYVIDQNGKEKKSISARIDAVGTQSSGSGNPFYIPIDIGTVTLILSAAAATIWGLVLARNLMRRKQRTEE